MAITRIGTAQSIAANNGNTSTINYLTDPIEGDYVFAFGGNGTATASTAMGPTAALGYTPVVTKTTAGPSCGIWYKKMGPTVDVTIDFQGDGLSADSSAYIIIVLRGVDPTNPIDAGPSAASNTSNAPAITTATDGAWILQTYANNASAPSGAPAGGYTLHTTRAGNDTNDIGIGLAFMEKAVAGSDDAGIWSGNNGTAQQLWAVAIKPFVDTPPPPGSGFEGWGIPI